MASGGRRDQCVASQLCWRSKLLSPWKKKEDEKGRARSSAFCGEIYLSFLKRALLSLFCSQARLKTEKTSLKQLSFEKSFAAITFFRAFWDLFWDFIDSLGFWGDGVLVKGFSSAPRDVSCEYACSAHHVLPAGAHRSF